MNHFKLAIRLWFFSRGLNNAIKNIERTVSLAKKQLDKNARLRELISAKQQELNTIISAQ